MNYVALSEVAKIIMGQSPPSATYNADGNGLPFFQGKADFGEIYPRPRVYCSKPNKIAESGDILITVRAPVGPTNLNRERSCIGRGLAALRVGTNLDRNYLFYFLRYYEPQLAKAGTGSTFTAISREDLENIKFPLPPLQEQQRIAAILQKADRLRRLRRYARQLSDGYLQSVFLEMFGDPATNPKGWKEDRIEDISLLVTDGEHITPNRTFSGIKLLSARNIQNGYIDFEAGIDFISVEEYGRIKKRCNPEFEDILISCSGSVGRVTTISTYEPFTLVRSVALIKPDKKQIQPYYLEHFLRTEYSQEMIKRYSKASSQANLFQGPIKELPVLIPSMAEQNRFVEYVKKYNQTKRLSAESERQTEILFQSLLQRAFQGEL